ncbi:hypothetical protein [Gracilibacillus thailandensis]|uniref:Uncharacterized protein n=1 Tax=Gracilibacillus thailandensis TaxID=563735 RepID=A0A6N7QT31_9BACI|nr:hypothetical protein [Gracilibacillus thailandensis]MRI65213.1 hypothetical protein [Gracilibacillus thailandensis]
MDLKSIEIISKMANEGEIEFKFFQDSARIRIKSDEFDESLKNYNFDGDRESFADQLDEFLTLAKDVALGNPTEEYSEESIELIKNNYLNDERINLINLQLRSHNNILEEVDTDIITKRSKTNSKSIISYNGLITLITRETHVDDVSDYDVLHLELTKKQIDTLIDELSKARKSIESIEKEE